MEIKSLDMDKVLKSARLAHQARLYAQIGRTAPNPGKLTLQSITRTVEDANGDVVEVTYHRGDAEFDEHEKFWKGINAEELALPVNFMLPISACGFELSRELKATMEKYHRGQIDKKAVEDTIAAIVDKQRSTYIELGFDAEEFMPQLLEDVYDAAWRYNVSGASIAGWYDSRSLTEQYVGHTRNTKDTIYYDAKYYYASEEMNASLREFTLGLAEKYDVSGDGLRLSNEASGKLCKRVYSSYNTYINFWARTVSDNGNMIDEDMVPPKGFRFFYKGNDSGVNRYPSNLISDGTPESEFDGILHVWYNDWAFVGRVPVRMDSTRFPTHVNMYDAVSLTAKDIPGAIVPFLKNFDLFSSIQCGKYLSTHPAKYKL